MIRLPWRPRAADGARAVVLDVETSGLDPEHDDLLAIAAVGVERRGGGVVIRPGDSFEVVLGRDTGAPPDKANILLHGIGAGRSAPASMRPRRWRDSPNTRARRS